MVKHSDHQSISSVDSSHKADTEYRAKIFAALADPTRLRIVELLAAQGELSGSEIANQMGISLALFCHHSRTLAEAGLIHIRREGQTKYNSLNRSLLSDCFSSLQDGNEVTTEIEH
ncbi:ArsR/SmtB family transcription factor [Pantanalinema rosaneae CENA516]|uniref:ArsR/SmtB family transcription factor n=1 Tax=Pantanalinema rosaneae TaxID=1620701 RepID=UPI003D6E1417